jgi:hypothetical protein
MGTGDVPRAAPNLAANALWVIDDSPVTPTPETREPFVAWPPPGYVPYQLTYPRWSFSYGNADFSSASVSMTENGAPISTSLEPVVGGMGDNSLVWIPKGLSNLAIWPQPASDVKYEVTIDNVLIGGAPRSFSYDVYIFDPNMLLADFNNSGSVNAADLAAWKTHFGKLNAVAADGDADRDLDVDGEDFLRWQRELGTTFTASAAVPEPRSIASAVLGVVLLGHASRQLRRLAKRAGSD